MCNKWRSLIYLFFWKIIRRWEISRDYNSHKKNLAIIIWRRGKLLVRFSGRGNPSTSPRIPNTTRTNMGMYVSGTPRRDQKCLGCSRWGWFIHKTRSATVHHERTLWINTRAFLLVVRAEEDSGGFTNSFGRTSFTLNQDTPPFNAGNWITILHATFLERN